MNKKQLTFYAFILTFGIACDEGSVKNFKYTTHTKNGNAPKNKNAPTKDLDKNAPTKDLDKNAPTKDLDKNAANYDNAINYDFTEEMCKVFFEYFQFDLKNIENKLFDLKDVENKLNNGGLKIIEYEEMKMIRDTSKAYFMLLIKPIREASAAFAKEDFKPIINFYKRVQS